MLVPWILIRVNGLIAALHSSTMHHLLWRRLTVPRLAARRYVLLATNAADAPDVPQRPEHAVISTFDLFSIGGSLLSPVLDNVPLIRDPQLVLLPPTQLGQ